MALTYSDSLRITLIGNGDQPGVWGSTTNTNLGTLLEDSIAGYVTVPVIALKQALTVVSGGVDEARNAMLRITTTNTANFEVYAPPVSKQYIIYNNTAYTATLYNSTVSGNTTAAGTGAAISAGQTLVCVSDGANFRLTNAGAGYVTLTGSEVLTNKTLTNVNFNGSYIEDVYNIPSATTFTQLDPTNGTIQTWTLSANSSTSISANFVSGMSMTLQVFKSAYTFSMSFVTWIGGSAPVYSGSGLNFIKLTAIGSTIYGQYLGATL